MASSETERRAWLVMACNNLQYFFFVLPLTCKTEKVMLVEDTA